MSHTSDVTAPEQPSVKTRSISARAEVHGLPREFYVSPDMFEREVQALFRPSWFFAGHVSELPEPRDYLTFDWRNESAVVLRTDDGEIVAHHNFCRHRGYRLFEGRSGRTRGQITCGYHGWCYAQTGELKNATRIGADQIDRDAWGLLPVAVEVWNGLIFVSFDADPTASLSAEVSTFDLSRFGLDRAKVAYRKQREFAANWKVISDNLNECYHCTLNHPELSQQLDVHTLDSGEGITVVPNGYLIDGMPLRGVSFTSTGETASSVLLGDAESPVTSALLVLFPGLMAFCYPDYVSILSVMPLAHDRTALENTFLVHESAVEGTDYDVDELTKMQLTATDQDEPLIARAWAGMQSPSFEFGPFHPEYEPPLAEFSDWYRSRMNVGAPGGPA